MNLVKVSTIAFLVMTLGALPAKAAVVEGGGFPAPGLCATCFSFTGDQSLAGGATLTLSPFDLNATDQLWWGPFVQATTNNSLTTLNLFSTTGNVAVWTGTSTVEMFSGTSSNVDLRFTSTLLTGTTGGWIDPSTAGDGIAAGPGIAQAVAEITGTSFSVNFIYEAQLAGGGGFTPLSTFYNNLSTPPGNASFAASSTNGQLYFTPVPLPAALPLFLSALAGLAFIGRRRRQAGA